MRKLPIERVGPVETIDIEHKEELVDWRLSFDELINKFTEVGVVLKGFRLREGWTQAEVALKLGIDQPNLSKMERGKRTIGKAMAKKLANLFGTDYRVFL